MGPKVQAACEFAEATGQDACIGALEDTARMLRGEAGTTVVKDAVETEYWPQEGLTGRPGGDRTGRRPACNPSASIGIFPAVASGRMAGGGFHASHPAPSFSCSPIPWRDASPCPGRRSSTSPTPTRSLPSSTGTATAGGWRG